MKRNLLILLGALFIFQGGCMLEPEYTRPEAPIPADWPSGPAYKETLTGERGVRIEDLEWQDFYADPKLQRVIELALANNRDLRSAALNIERARAIYQIQRSELFPTVDVQGVASKERVPGIVSGFGQVRTVELYNVNVGISAWELDLFGRIRSLKKRALQEYLATEQARNIAQISLMAEVANTYLTFAADRERLKLAQETYRTQQTSYNLIKRRYDEGISSEIDLYQAQTRLDAARVDIARYTSLTAIDENLLNLLAGIAIPKEFLPENFEAIEPMRDIAVDLPSEALARRPDIMEAENLLKAANANIGAARAAFFPQITLTTSIGTTSDELSGLFQSGSRTWLFAPQATLPIFDAGRNRANLREAETEHSIFLAQYEQTIQEAFREVADALAQRGTLGDQLAAQESLVDASAASYRLSETRYLKGIDSYLAVLDSQRSLYSDQQSLIDVQQARLTNLLTLYKVLGGG